MKNKNILFEFFFGETDEIKTTSLSDSKADKERIAANSGLLMNIYKDISKYT